MPKVPKEMLSVACYLYQSVEEAATGSQFGGTAFFVSLPTVDPAQKFVYAVSNWHVAVRDGASVLRVNRRDGKPEVFDFGPEEWIFSPKYDIAVTPVPLTLDHMWGTVPLSGLAGKSWIEKQEIGPGDDVFMVGRFVDHDGGPVNSPALRFGNISTNPVPIKQANGRMADAYCIDMHSRTGYSGSPVFVYRSAGQDLGSRDLTLAPGYMSCLGIHFGQFPEYWRISELTKDEIEASGHSLITEGKYVRGLSGMTTVLPSWYIEEVINLPQLKAARDHENARIAAGLIRQP